MARKTDAEEKLTAVDDGNGHEDTGSASNSAHQIGDNGQETEDSSAKGSSSGDDAFEFLVHRTLTVSSHNHLLFLELFGNVPGATSRNFNPGLGEQGTGGQSEGNIDEGVNGVKEGGGQSVGGRHVIGDTSDGAKLR